MDFETYKTSLAEEAPPEGLSMAAQALWWEAKGIKTDRSMSALMLSSDSYRANRQAAPGHLPPVGPESAIPPVLHPVVVGS